MSSRRTVPLYKVDCTLWTVRLVQGDPDDCDDEGSKCYSNSHYRKESDAWECLFANARAAVVLAGGRVQRAQQELRDAEVEAGRAAAAFAKIDHARQQRE